MSKFVTSEVVPRSSVPEILWRLLQTFWVGGIWLLHFLVLPGLSQSGLAQLLVDEVAAALVPQMVAVSLCSALMQLLILARWRGFAALFRERAGQLLLAVVCVALALLAVLQLGLQALYWQTFAYLLLAFFGFLLVIQPLPVARATA